MASLKIPVDKYYDNLFITSGLQVPVFNSLPENSSAGDLAVLQTGTELDVYISSGNNWILVSSTGPETDIPLNEVLNNGNNAGNQSILNVEFVTFTPNNRVAITNQNITNNNIVIGFNSAAGLMGQNNVVLGDSSMNGKTAANATCIGRMAGNAANQVSIGDHSGMSSAPVTVCIGHFAGQNDQGAQAVAIGFYAGSSQQGSQSTVIGYLAGQNICQDGAVCIGESAGQNTCGANSVCIGYQAGQTNLGPNNVYIGNNARSQGSSNNVVIGNLDMAPNSTNGIAIGNNITDMPTNSVQINASAIPMGSYDPNTTRIRPIRLVEFVPGGPWELLRYDTRNIGSGPSATGTFPKEILIAGP